MPKILGSVLGKELCLALGIPIDNVFGISINCEMDSVASITIKRYLTVSEIPDVKQCLEKYEVVKKDG